MGDPVAVLGCQGDGDRGYLEGHILHLSVGKLGAHCGVRDKGAVLHKAPRVLHGIARSDLAREIHLDAEVTGCGTSTKRHGGQVDFLARVTLEGRADELDLGALSWRSLASQRYDKAKGKRSSGGA